jgi:hypothetical protein
MASLLSSNVDLNDLRLEEVTFYLNRTDWKKIESRNKNFLLFQGPFRDDSNEVIELALPYNSALPHEDLARIINALSVIENRSPNEIVKSIKSLDKDILFIRISDPAIFNNSISFDRSVEVMKILEPISRSFYLGVMTTLKNADLLILFMVALVL